MDFLPEEEKIIFLYKEGKWNDMIEQCEKNSFLPWIWPDQKNLKFIGKYIREENGNCLISVGCGSGLLEWLIMMATGIKVIGIELDKGWWKSKYVKQTFIPMEFIEDANSGHEKASARQSVLLFCYFNNEIAFLNYIDSFKGNCFIGPEEGRGIHTAPRPFRLPRNLKDEWKLLDFQEIRNSKDYIAVYSRIGNQLK